MSYGSSGRGWIWSCPLHVEALGNTLKPVHQPPEGAHPFECLLVRPIVSVSLLRQIHQSIEFFLAKPQSLDHHLKELFIISLGLADQCKTFLASHLSRAHKGCIAQEPRIRPVSLGIEVGVNERRKTVLSPEDLHSIRTIIYGNP